MSGTSFLMARIAWQTRFSVVERFGAGFVALARLGIGEQREARDGELGGPLRGADRFIDREALDVGHRGDRRPDLGALDQKQRPDQVVGREYMLAHHAPRPFGAAVAARTYRQIEAFGRGSASTGEGRPRSQRPAEFDRHGALRIAARSFYPFRPDPPLASG